MKNKSINTLNHIPWRALHFAALAGAVAAGSQLVVTLSEEVRLQPHLTPDAMKIVSPLGKQAIDCDMYLTSAANGALRSESRGGNPVRIEGCEFAGMSTKFARYAQAVTGTRPGHSLYENSAPNINVKIVTTDAPFAVYALSCVPYQDSAQRPTIYYKCDRASYIARLSGQP